MCGQAARHANHTGEQQLVITGTVTVTLNHAHPFLCLFAYVEANASLHVSVPITYSC